MTYGAWKTGKLPLMRDGRQYRPMVHIQDTTDVMLLLLSYDKSKINGEIFNVGSEKNNFQLETLGKRIANYIQNGKGRKVGIEWYGEPDYRSYLLSFDKIEERLQWKAKWTLEQGVSEIINAIENDSIDKTSSTITLEWYQQLTNWHKIIKEVEKYGGILDIN